MDQVATDAASAVRHEDEAAARRWFEVIGEEHAALLATGSLTWDDFTRRLRERTSEESFDDDDVAQFVEHVEAATTTPLDVVAELADEDNRDELVAAAIADDEPGAEPAADEIEAETEPDDDATGAVDDTPELFEDAASGLLYDAAGSWFLRDRVTQVHADDSGYFYDADGNWYLDGELAPQDVADAGAIDEEVPAAGEAVAAVERTAEAVAAELVDDGSLPAELGDDLRTALGEVLAEMPDAAGMSDEEIRQLFSEIAREAAPAS